MTFGKKMNSYASHLESAKGEIRAFAASDAGKKWDAHWHSTIEDLVDKTKSATSDEAAERYLDMLLWCIVDSGPLVKEFAPSIDRAADAMQRKRKKAFKARRLAKEAR